MFSSESISRDMSRSNSSFLAPNQAANFKHVLAEGPDCFPNQAQVHLQSSGLARYRSAPGSFLTALLDSNTDNSSSGDESEAFFSALLNGTHQKNNININHNNDNQSDNHQMQQYHMKQEVGVDGSGPRPGQNGSAGYERAVNVGGGSIVGSYSLGMESQVHVRVNSGNSSNNLVRQSSSPAGFFNEFGVIGEVGNHRIQNHVKANSSASGMSNHMNFSSSGPSSSSRFMPTIPENGNEGINSARNAENGQLRNNGSNSANGREFESVFPHNSWNDSQFSNSLKRNRDGDLKMFSNFNGLENQNGEIRKSSNGLVHHLSLPKDIAEIEKFLQFQPETVPCQIRAKRGCATHPRSIAERMRRTRISEKMKKLQDLFPNMDKQTSTADMLDLAVEYIKDLQKQLETLTDTKAKCICSNKPQQTTPTT